MNPPSTTSSKKGRKWVSMRLELKAKESKLQEILKTIAAGIENGVFIAVPGGRCPYCEFRMICGTVDPNPVRTQVKGPEGEETTWIC